jgi:hypothetical protein
MEVKDVMGFEKEQRPFMKTYDERYSIQNVLSTGTAILGYGVTTLSSTKLGLRIFRINPPLFAGVDKTIIVTGKANSTSTYRIIPNTTTVLFGSTVSSTGRAVNFTARGETVQLIATSATKYYVVSNLASTFGST